MSRVSESIVSISMHDCEFVRALNGFYHFSICMSSKCDRPISEGHCQIEEEVRVRVGRHQQPQPLAVVIHDAFQQVIALPPGLLDPLVARDQFRVPLVRLARHKRKKWVPTAGLFA